MQYSVNFETRDPIPPPDGSYRLYLLSNGKIVISNVTPRIAIAAAPCQILVKKEYDPEFGDNCKCSCGHEYHRHFDSYEGMDPVGCKYCDCADFTT